jgi:hypothetical protein
MWAAADTFWRCAQRQNYGSVAYIATPIVIAAFGASGLAQILPIIALHSGVILPLAAMPIELGSQSGERFRLVSLLRGSLHNPIVMSIGLGFFWHATGLPVPGPLQALLALLAKAAPGLALFLRRRILASGFPRLRQRGSDRSRSQARRVASDHLRAGVGRRAVRAAAEGGAYFGRDAYRPQRLPGRPARGFRCCHLHRDRDRHACRLAPTPVWTAGSARALNSPCVVGETVKHREKLAPLGRAPMTFLRDDVAPGAGGAELVRLLRPSVCPQVLTRA